MGNISEKVEAAAAPVTGSSPAPPEQPKKLKPCCACPETKRARDAWLVLTFKKNIHITSFLFVA